MELFFEITDTPESQALTRVQTGLTEYNEAEVGPAEKRALAVFVRDEDEAVVAGLLGNTAWGWLYVQWLWIDDRARGQGLAGEMLAKAETEATARGCHGAYIDTFNPVALKVYQKAGYAVFGALPEFPKGRTRSFLQKRLVP